MPYQAGKDKSDVRPQLQPHETLSETDEQAVANTVQGADLLLSLTKTPQHNNLVVTPPDASNNTTSDEIVGKKTELSDGVKGPPIAAMLHQHPHRMLYHSPIKVASSGSGSMTKDPRNVATSDFIQSELAPYAMVPAWSPSVYNGMIPPYLNNYARSPTFQKQHDRTQIDESNKKDKRNDSEEKKDMDDGSVSIKKQRMISPANSSDKNVDETPTDLVSADTKATWSHRLPSGGPQHPMIYHVPTHWHQQPGYPPSHVSYPHPPPNYPMYAHYPPPWVMYGRSPPPHSPGMFPPTFSATQKLNETSTEYPNDKKNKEVPRRVSKESSLDKIDRTASSSPAANSNIKRCIRLKDPVPSRSWSATNAERRLPDFSLLVNFPDYLSKGRNSEKTISSEDGTRKCVMCGEARLCSVPTATNSNGGGGRRARLLPPDVSGETKGDEATTHIIPRQNKGVCTVCDVAVWMVVDLDNFEIRWCKGCKNFRPWAAFGDKGLATKCVRCRKRQKEKYATQKVSSANGSRRSLVDDDYIENRNNMAAANGLRKLMESSTSMF